MAIYLYFSWNNKSVMVITDNKSFIDTLSNLTIFSRHKPISYCYNAVNVAGKKAINQTAISRPRSN